MPASRSGSLLWLGTILVLLLASFGLLVYLGYHALMRPAPSGGAETATPPEAPSQRPPAAAAGSTPGDTAADAQRTPDGAFRELRAALDRADARTAARYLLKEKLAQLQTEQQVLDELTPLAAEALRITETRQRGDKAVLFAQALSGDITSADGRPARIDVVVQMLREAGHWKVFRQLWLVNTPPTEQQREALTWLGASAPAGRGAGSVRKLEADRAGARGRLLQARGREGVAPRGRRSEGDGQRRPHAAGVGPTELPRRGAAVAGRRGALRASQAGARAVLSSL